jgi:hypothetical protein
MFGSLLKLTFWGGLALLFIPLDTGQAGPEQPVSGFEAIVAARDTIADLRGLCERQPDVCETGGAAIETISVRAKAAARLALDYVESTPAAEPVVQ